MTPEEVVSDINEFAKKKVIEKGGVPSDVMMKLLFDVGMYGFRLGSNTALSMVKGQLLVQLVKADKSKEVGK